MSPFRPAADTARHARKPQKIELALLLRRRGTRRLALTPFAALEKETCKEAQGKGAAQAGETRASSVSLMSSSKRETIAHRIEPAGVIGVPTTVRRPPSAAAQEYCFSGWVSPAGRSTLAREHMDDGWDLPVSRDASYSRHPHHHTTPLSAPSSPPF